jgi:hypothetical protein
MQMVVDNRRRSRRRRRVKIEMGGMVDVRRKKRKGNSRVQG